MHNLEAITKMLAERGPRYAVTGTIRQHEYYITFPLTSAAAETALESFAERGYYDTRVHQPVDAGPKIDLAKYGRDLADARRVVSERTIVLRAAVLRAVDANPDRSEDEIARTTGEDPAVVRAWLGR